ncbi:MAG TPA: hypothetical protein PKY81_13800 [bacterium]|nr:hypothetical protein [bacterium]HPN32020.1 hypothetical protein [bacterium]
MNYFIVLFFSIVSAFVIPAFIEIKKIAALPDFFIKFDFGAFTAVLIFFFIDYLIFDKLAAYPESRKSKYKNIGALAYSPVIFLFFYKYIYCRINFLDRNINGELKEIKYLIGVVAALIIVFKIIAFCYFYFKKKVNEKEFKLKEWILACFFVYVFFPGVILKYYAGSAGDEKEYILNVYSLANNFELNLVDDIKYVKEITGGSEHAPPLNFYPKKNKIYSLHSNLIPFHLVLLIPYYAFGRIGIILLMTVINAFLALILYKIAKLCVKSGSFDSIEVFFYWSAVIISPFFFIYNYQIYPEIAAGLANAVFVYIAKKRKITELYFITIILSGLIFWFNFRYVFFGVSYILIYFFTVGLKNIFNKKNLIIPVVFMVSIILYLIANFLIYDDFSFSANTLNKESRFLGYDFYRTIPALFFDQHYGVFFYMPAIAYFLFGFFRTALFSKLKTEILLILFYLIPLSFYSGNWFGGQSPPFRLIIPIIPLIYIGGISVIENIMKTRISKWVFIIFTVYGIIINIILFAIPGLLYNLRFNGNNQIFEKIEWYCSIPVVKFFPSFMRNSDLPHSYKLTFIYFCVIITLYLIYRKEVKEK